ncbi:MAG: hypothetical protein GWN80_11475, partial [Gammaproteobacteria bacterium]|nr:hypothetical protein [Gammaproteobacteria bacterium]
VIGGYLRRGYCNRELLTRDIDTLRRGIAPSTISTYTILREQPGAINPIRR